MTHLMLPEIITHDQAQACLQLLTCALHSADAGSRVCVDATALKRFDSSAPAVLLACRREALRTGKTFSVQGMPPKLAQLTELYGVQSLFETDGGGD